MTRKEELEYRQMCPYDAMGDYSALFARTKWEEPDDGSGKEPESKKVSS